MSVPVTWHFEGQVDQIWLIRNRGLRWFYVEPGEYAAVLRWQPGDIAVLWPGDEQGGEGLAAMITHLAFVEDGDVTHGAIASIGEPFAARAVVGGDEDDGGD